MKPTRDDLAAYAMGTYDGDVAALEAALAADDALRAQLAEECELEMLLRDAGASATFCAACDDLVRGERCAACGAAVRPGGYRIEKVLVANAHGRMYVARDADGTQVALKELAFVQSPGPDAVTAFEREAKFLRALEHPAIPRFCASFEEGDGVHTRYYLAQELVAGESLDARLEDHFFTEAEVVALARQVLEVLVYLQSLSPMVIHRDIKPANLIRRADGSIALVDFGAAHVQGTTAGSTSIGTFGYMPIEQLAGQVDATTDLYALGASLVHLLTRQEPWRIMSSDLIATINVSQPLRRFLEKLVAPRREDRFPTAAAALAALENRDALPVARKRRSWRPFALAGIAAVGLGGAGAVGFALGDEGKAVRVAVDEGSSADAGLPAPCMAYAMQVDRLRRCSALSPELQLRLRGEADAILHAARFASHGDREQQAQQCSEARIELARETSPICSDWAVPPVPPIPPLPPMAPLAPLVEHHDYNNAKKLAMDFKAAPLADVLRFFGGACDVNVVLPDYIKASVTVRLKDVPCDQALEVLLESHGLWYRYAPEGNLLQIQARRQLDREDEEVIARARSGWSRVDVLPPGPTIDLDLKDAPLQDVVQMFATAGKVNVVMPDVIKGKVTVKLAKVPWDASLRAVLAAHGLGFRYREKGRVVRVAPQRELDREDEEARAREQR